MSKTDNTASDFVQGLRKFPAPSEVFILTRVKPGADRKDFRFRVALLHDFEEVEIERAAQQFAREAGETGGHDTILQMARAHELVAKCLVAEEPFELPDGTMMFHRVFTSGQQVRENLLNCESAQILNAYMVTKEKYSAIHILSPDRLDEWTRNLADELTGASFLSHLDSSLWGPLLLLFAQKLAPLLPPVSPQSSSQGSGESDLQTSDGGTGTFTELPAMLYETSQTEFPRDKQLSALEAAELAKKL